MTESPAGPPRGLHRYAVCVAAATFLLVIAGGLVTSTGSGLAVPDWPLSFGQVFPRMEGGVLFEHGHRLIASTVGLLTVILAIWTWRADPRPWVKKLGLCLVGVVILQGVLGGVTVLLRLPDAVSVAHAGLAQVFFALTCVLATVTSPRFVGAPQIGRDAGTPATRSLVLYTAAAIYAQILLGAIVRHTGAALAIPDFPLSFGKLVPPFNTSLVLWNYLHRVGALVVSLMIGWTTVRMLREHGRAAYLLRPALALFALLCWQIFLGALTIWTRRAVTPTTAHVATGALIFVTSVVLAVRAQRVLGEPEASRSEPLPHAAGTAAA